MENNWFESWFDSKYYHLLYKDRDYSEAENFVRNLGEQLSLSAEDYILDLACGKGRHSKNLAQTGARVLGLDLSQQSILEASQFSNDRLAFGVHDMRQAIYQGPFSVVVNLFTSFGYFDSDEENGQAIQNMSDALQPGGSLILDFMNTPKVIHDLVEAEIKTVEHVKFAITRSVSQGWIVKRIRFKDDGKDFKFEERVRAIQKSDFETYFQKSGLTLQQIYGDYDFNHFDEALSPRMIFKLTK